MPKKKVKNFIYAIGRRKSSSARVRLYKGSEQSTVNNFPIGQYFPGELNRVAWSKPFAITETEGKYFVTVKTAGGGKNGQLEATVLGIARALSLANPEKFKSLLKKEGLFTRDSRIRQRRMVGTGGRARHQKQSPKR